MKHTPSKLQKGLLAVALAGLLGLGATSASAVVFPDFTVDPPPFSNPPVGSFVADKITGNYAEVITFDGLGNFAVSIKWQAGQFVADDGVNALPGVTTGLGNTYGVYALFKGTGTVAGGPTDFSFALNPGGTLDLYLDRFAGITTFTQPATGNLAWTTANDGDDSLLGSGNALYGSGNLNTGCSGGINCGSFGQTTNFSLTATGSQFFILPVPFYNLTFESGQFNNFTPVGTQVINGSLDAVFAVPEPGTLALLGLSLVGIGALRRNRKEA